MKSGRLLIAAVLLAFLAAGVWWSNKKTNAAAAKPPADTSPKVLTLNADGIRQMEFKHRSGAPSIVKKDDSGKWEITAPSAVPADQYVVGNVATALSSLSSDRVVDDKATDLASYGLAPPEMEVDITMKDGKTSKLLVGDDTPTGSDLYVMRDGDPRLFITSTSNKSNLDRTYKDLRDKHLMTFQSDQVSRLELTTHSKGKTQDIEFGRINQTDWQILKPRPLRADGSKVEDLLRDLQQATLVTLSDEEEKKAPGAFASAPVLAVAKVTSPSGMQTIEVRKAGSDYYAKSSVVAGVQKVTTDVGTGLDKSLDDFRNKKIFDFGFSDPNKITFTDGGKTVEYEKSGDKWLSGGKNMDSLSLQAFIDKLRDLSATKFDESGFTTPAIDLTVVSNDGKRTEKVQIAPTQGGNFLARREGDQTLYELDAQSIKDLRQAAQDIKEAQPPPKPAEKKK